MRKCLLLIALCVLEGFMLPAEVLALRPFVTTDADVVETNLVEIELGIFGLHTQRHPGADELTLDILGIRFNYGLPWDSEIVLETVGELIDNEYKGELGIKEKQFAHTTGFYKKVWWRGSDWIPNFATRKQALYFPQKKTPLD